MSHSEILLSLWPVGCLLPNIVTHAAFNHLTKGRSHLLSIAVGFIVGLGSGIFFLARIVAAQEVSHSDRPGIFLLNVLTYCGLGYGYFVFVNLNFASLRIRLLKEILACGQDGLPVSTLRATYDPQAILDARLKRLVEWNQLAETNGRFTICRKGFLTAARVINLLKWIVLGRPLS